jgi:serine/threonine protein kinase
VPVSEAAWCVLLQISVYKALLDTASGLDYLHSIGIAHGDLKTCNVLLKGSARDVRGFCCKIANFGLSRVLDMDATHISTRTYGEFCCCCILGSAST